MPDGNRSDWECGALSANRADSSGDLLTESEWWQLAVSFILGLALGVLLWLIDRCCLNRAPYAHVRGAASAPGFKVGAGAASLPSSPVDSYGRAWASPQCAAAMRQPLDSVRASHERHPDGSQAMWGVGAYSAGARLTSPPGAVDPSGESVSQWHEVADAWQRYVVSPSRSPLSASRTGIVSRV